MSAIMSRSRLPARRVLTAGPAAIAACVLIAGCGSGGSSGGSSTSSSSNQTANTSSGAGYGAPQPAGSGAGGSAAEVTVRHGPLGTYLTNGKGLTLYLFAKDGKGSECAGVCAQAWPPLTTTGKPSAGTGAEAAMLASIARPDGTKQVTYAGHPLYRYADDTKPGQTEGEGSTAFGAGWYVLKPSGAEIAGG